jgi:hypothetical protein
MEEGKKIPTRLQEVNKENSFSVPKGYFDDFQKRMQERIHAEQGLKKPEQVSRVIPRIAWITAVAAIFVIGFFVARNIIGTDTSQSLSQEDIAYALEQEILELDEVVLMSNIHEMDMEQGNGYTDEVILYLIDEDIELDKIVNEL